MPLSTEVGIGPGHILLDGDPASPTERGTAAPRSFRPMFIVAKWSPISATAELMFEITPGHWKWHHVIDHMRLPVGLLQ